MSSIVEAVVARIIEALPFATITRNEEKPNGVAPGGWVNVHDGDPGEPDVCLGPPNYTYDHQIPVEIMGFDSTDLTAEQVLDQLLKPIGDAFLGDPYLDGLADYATCSAAVKSRADLFGAPELGLAEFTITVTYTTTSPLG